MKSRYNLRIATIAVFCAVVTFAAAASTQKASDTGPKYDAANQVKIKGVIDDVKETPGELSGTYLTVKTDTSTVIVYVAPAEFLKDIDTSFKKGDQLRSWAQKAPALMASRFWQRSCSREQHHNVARRERHSRLVRLEGAQKISGAQLKITCPAMTTDLPDARLTISRLAGIRRWRR